MKVTPAAGSRPDRKNAAVIVVDLRITVVESSEAADPGLMEDALATIVKWAVRAHKRGHSTPDEAATVETCSTYDPEI